MFITHIPLETHLPFSVLDPSAVPEIATVTTLLHQVMEIEFDFTLGFASSKLTVGKSEKTCHQDTDPAPRKPPLGGFLCLQPLPVLP